MLHGPAKKRTPTPYPQQSKGGVGQAQVLQRADRNAGLRNACLWDTNTTINAALCVPSEQPSTAHNPEKDAKENLVKRTTTEHPEISVFEKQSLRDIVSSRWLRAMSHGSASTERDNHTTPRSWSRKPAVNLNESLKEEAQGPTTKNGSTRREGREDSLAWLPCMWFFAAYYCFRMCFVAGSTLQIVEEKGFASGFRAPVSSPLYV